jgi:hypothetical protein
MCSDFDVVRLAIPHSFEHNQRVTGMESTGNVGMVDQRQQLEIWSADIISILRTESVVADRPKPVLTASPRSTFRSALYLIGGGAILALNMQPLRCFFPVTLDNKLEAIWSKTTFPPTYSAQRRLGAISASYTPVIRHHEAEKHDRWRWHPPARVSRPWGSKANDGRSVA